MGPAHDVPTGGAVGNKQRLQGMQHIVPINLSGGVTKGYYDVYRAMTAAGRPTSVDRVTPYPAEDDYGAIVYIETDGFAGQ